eukprot:6415306-Prymnesium_polylepis.2
MTSTTTNIVVSGWSHRKWSELVGASGRPATFGIASLARKSSTASSCAHGRACTRAAHSAGATQRDGQKSLDAAPSSKRGPKPKRANRPQVVKKRALPRAPVRVQPRLARPAAPPHEPRRRTPLTAHRTRTHTSTATVCVDGARGSCLPAIGWPTAV